MRQRLQMDGYCEKILIRPLSIWLTGLSGAGKSTLAAAIRDFLQAEGNRCIVLDGDLLRKGLNRDLGFSPEDRRENIRRIAEIAKLFNEAGFIVIVAVISPYRVDRDMARQTVGHNRFVEFYLNADLATCEARDPKGLYAKARNGMIADFTGISAPYEPPVEAELTIPTGAETAESSVRRIKAYLMFNQQADAESECAE